MRQSEFTLLMNNESDHIAEWFIIFSTSHFEGAELRLHNFAPFVG